MLDLSINQMRFDFTNAAGHEHRIGPVVRRALDLAAARMPTDLTLSMDVESLKIEPIRLPLESLSDEHAAQQIAAAVLDALALKLNV
jgi:hypothetical protein